MKTFALSIVGLVGVLTLATGCTSGLNGHGESDDHHASAEGGGEDHHESEIGMPGEAGSVDRTIKVSMDDTMPVSYTHLTLPTKA